MNQQYQPIIDMTRDFGVLAGDTYDIAGVDEVSLCMKAMSVVLESLAAHEHAHAPYLQEDADVWSDDRLVAPPVIGA